MSDITKPYTILAVDDERANLNLLQRTFRKDYEMLLAGNAQEGLGILEKQSVDMIITDQRMPRMTGVQMLEKSLKLVPDAMRIVLTAYADVQDIIAAINSGHIYRYILKPWTPEDLRSAVATAFNHYELQNENRELVAQLRKSLEELKAAQAELLNRERLSTVGRMAATIIHDLKQPMSNIRTSASFLSMPTLTDELRVEYSDTIKSEVDRLLGMTREILDYSKGEVKLKLEEFNFEEFLDSIAAQIRNDYADFGISLNCEWNDLGAYYGDHERLRRVLFNLAINAREAMNKGGALTIRAARKKEEMILTFADTGPGIPAEIVDKIFEPFVTHGKHNGTGLGMAIAKMVVDNHHGAIEARNRSEGGAEFTVHLPVVRFR